MNRAAATKAYQVEPARIVAPLAGYGAEGAAHVGVDQQVDAVSRLNFGQVQWPGHIVGDGAAGQLGVDGEVTSQQVLRIQVAQQHVGVGYGGVLTAELVAGWAGESAGALGADAEGAAAVYGGDTAAPCAHFGQVDGWDAQDVAAAPQQPVAHTDAAANLVLRGLQHLAVLNDGSLGSGSAHIQGHQVGHIETAAEVEGSNDTGSRSGLDAVHRALHGNP